MTTKFDDTYYEEKFLQHDWDDLLNLWQSIEKGKTPGWQPGRAPLAKGRKGDGASGRASASGREGETARGRNDNDNGNGRLSLSYCSPIAHS
jgi:hypothetical protein